MPRKHAILYSKQKNSNYLALVKGLVEWAVHALYD